MSLCIDTNLNLFLYPFSPATHGYKSSLRKSLSAVLNLEVTALLTSAEVCGIPVQILADTSGPTYGIKKKLCVCLSFQLSYLPRDADLNPERCHLLSSVEPT